jgi:hypothetical protein
MPRHIGHALVAIATVGVIGCEAPHGPMVIDVNYSCRLATAILAGPECGRGCDKPAAD